MSRDTEQLGLGWLQYDRLFRKKAAGNASFSWGEYDIPLYVAHVLNKKHFGGFRVFRNPLLIPEFAFSGICMAVNSEIAGFAMLVCIARVTIRRSFVNCQRTWEGIMVVKVLRKGVDLPHLCLQSARVIND